MTITDANLLLGRLLPDFFPKIFGPNEDEPIDLEVTKSKFEQLTAEASFHLRKKFQGLVVQFLFILDKHFPNN